MDFACVKDCSQCCTERAYYPSVEYGKIGVLILPGERDRIRKKAAELGVSVSIVPRIGVSEPGAEAPDEVMAYQMMGIEKNGNTCPFLGPEGGPRSPHGGRACTIYKDRPLACAAYPLVGADPPVLDGSCRFCKECGDADGNLSSEEAALAGISSAMEPGGRQVWRYATGVGEPEDAGRIRTGWIRD